MRFDGFPYPLLRLNSTLCFIQVTDRFLEYIIAGGWTNYLWLTFDLRLNYDINVLVATTELLWLSH